MGACAFNLSLLGSSTKIGANKWTVSAVTRAVAQPRPRVTVERSQILSSKQPRRHCILAPIPMKKLPLFFLIIALAGCATMTSSPTLTCSPEVRRQSVVSDPLFNDLLTKYGGIGHADKAAYPEAKERTIIRIEVIYPYDNERTGSEHWTIQHDAGKTAVYQVRLVPDGEGSVDFSVSEVK